MKILVRDISTGPCWGCLREPRPASGHLVPLRFIHPARCLPPCPDCLYPRWGLHCAQGLAAGVGLLGPDTWGPLGRSRHCRELHSGGANCPCHLRPASSRLSSGFSLELKSCLKFLDTDMHFCWACSESKKTGVRVRSGPGTGPARPLPAALPMAPPGLPSGDRKE